MKEILILTPFYLIIIMLGTIIIMKARHLEKKLGKRKKELE